MNPELNSLNRFYDKLLNHNNDRFISFQHCYSHFKDLDKDSFKQNKELSMLHLGFYLASWGMYRGSSFLLQKDYNIYESVINEVLDPKYKDLLSYETKLNNSNLLEFRDLVFDLHENLESILNVSRQEYIDFSGKGDVENDVSSILTTKIMMGSMGIIPAYDQFYKKGIGIYNKTNDSKLVANFSPNSVKKIFQFMLDNKEELISIRDDIFLRTKFKNPLMKLIDSYFWMIGFE